MAVLETTFRSYTLNRSVTFSALIPADRGLQSGKEPPFCMEGFKTLYLLHGYTGDHRDFINLTDISTLADTLKIAIIFPNGENSFYLEDQDIGTSHSAFVGKEIVELTRCIFPLSEKREDTYIGGISMGAYGALINGLRYTETFSRIFSMSGAFLELDIADRRDTLPDGVFSKTFQHRVFGDPVKLRQSNKDPRFLIEQLLKQGQTIPQIYQICGTDDLLIKVNRTLHHFLQKHNVNHIYCEDTGAHDWNYWSQNLGKCLKWLIED
jgi:putative tributyrin esterase